MRYRTKDLSMSMISISKRIVVNSHFMKMMRHMLKFLMSSKLFPLTYHFLNQNQYTSCFLVKYFKLKITKAAARIFGKKITFIPTMINSLLII